MRRMKSALVRLAAAAVAVLALLVVADWLMGGATRRLLAGHATLDVASEPAGAAVYVDAVRQGETPLVLELAPGHRVLKVSHRYHADYVEALDVERDARVERRLTLPPGRGRLALISNPKGASVTLDGDALPGVTPLSIDVAAGEHTLHFALPGRLAAERRVDVLHASIVEVRVDLDRERLGELVVTVSPPGAKVVIGDSDLKFLNGMALPVGYYRLEVSHPGYEAKTVEVVVNLGSNRVRVDLERAR
jgi:hypothetical protein